jgi:hypothetical protein
MGHGENEEPADFGVDKAIFLKACLERKSTNLRSTGLKHTILDIKVFRERD